AALQQQPQVTLAEIAERQPLQHGLAELVAYLQLGSESFRTVVDDSATELIAWRITDPDGGMRRRRARMPRVIFVRTNNG
ncbi:DUF3375 family protein, partial [Acinetobacter baumannii]|uniref:DUF3375 family protein n=1 Tax=Acinetobacter baumannii TaxID=470 RepID=UPI001899CE5C